MFVQQLAAASCQLPLSLDWLPAIAGTTDEDLSWSCPAQLPLEHFDRVDLNVNKSTPWFRMGRKTLHEAGIAVCAAMRTAGIAIQRVIADAGPVQNRFAFFPANNHAVFSGCNKVGLIDSFLRGLCEFELMLLTPLRHLLKIAFSTHT